jgi:hypothetical protein
MRVNLLSAAVAGAVVCGVAGMASATRVEELIAFDGTQNTISDENREFVIERAGSPLTLDVGDSVRGIIGFNTITNSTSGLVAIGGVGAANTGNNELTGVFQLFVIGKVLADNPGTPFPDFVFEFAPDPTFAEALALGTAAAAVGLPGSTAILWEQDTAAGNNFTPDGVGVAAATATATDGSLFWNLGFTGPLVASPNGVGAPEMSAAGEAWVGYGADTITALAGSTIGSSNFYVSRVAPTGIGGGWQLLPRPGHFGLGAVEITGNSNIRGLGTVIGPDSFVQETDSTIQFNVIPLPAAAWSGLALLGAMGLNKLRRRVRD